MGPLTYLKLGLLAALIGGGVYLAWSYRDMAGDIATANARIDAAEAAAASAKRDAKAAQEAAARLSAEIVSRAEIDQKIRASRQSVANNLDEVHREDPVSRSYLDEPLPQRVRDAIRDR